MTAGRRLLWAISFHHLCNDGTLMVLVALLPVLKDEMGISYYEVGLLGFGLLVTVVAQYIVGRVADRKASPLMLESGAALMALSFFVLLFVNDFVGLFLVVIVMRIGAAFYHPVGISWITKAYGGSRLDTALGIQSGVGNLGVIIALATSGFLGEAFGWKIPCAVWTALNVSAVMIGIITVRTAGFQPTIKTDSIRISPLATARKIGLLAIPIVAGGALYQVTSYFGPLNLTKTGEWTAGGADAVFSIWIGIGAITSYYFGRVSAVLSKERILAVSYLASSIATLMLAFVNQRALVSVTLFFYGALLYLTYPALFAIVTLATVERERGTAFGILFGFQLGGGAATVYVSGIVADALSDPAYAFVIVSVLALVSVAAFAVWQRTTGSAKAQAGH